MCGRVTLKTPSEIVARFLGITISSPPPWVPRFNIAPTQLLFAARQAAPQRERELAAFRWGLTPFLPAGGQAPKCIINVRAETAGEKRSFKSAFLQRRCLIPVDGFYEWKGSAKKRQPFHIRMRDGTLFALAGIWDKYHNTEQPVDACAILTTDANSLVRTLHDRMPLIINPADFDAWLDPALEDADKLQPLLQSYPAEQMEAVPVNIRVNDPKNEGEECLQPARDRSAPEPTLWDV